MRGFEVVHGVDQVIELTRHGENSGCFRQNLELSGRRGKPELVVVCRRKSIAGMRPRAAIMIGP
jgi:hypothetical protein